jgi:hypothetical protein
MSKLHPDAALAAVASRQHGVFSAAQAIELGLSWRRIHTGAVAGRWVRLHGGVYRIAGAPHTWHTGVIAGCFGGDALASHRSAAVLWGLDGFRQGRVEITRRRGTNFRAPGIRSHESLDLHLAEGTVRQGIPTTGLARTLVDLGAVVRVEAVERAIDDAVRRGLVDLPTLWSTLAAHSRRGRRGVGALRKVLDERTPLGATDSWFEHTFVKALGTTPLPPPVLQHEITDDRGFVARVDLAWPSRMVAVELDGKAFHLNAEAFERDAAKRNRLRLAGWLVLVVTWEMFRTRFYAVVTDIERALLGSRQLLHAALPLPSTT